MFWKSHIKMCQYKEKTDTDRHSNRQAFGLIEVTRHRLKKPLAVDSFFSRPSVELKLLVNHYEPLCSFILDISFKYPKSKKRIITY